MIKTLTIAILAIAISGCSAFGGDEPVAAAPVAGNTGNVAGNPGNVPIIETPAPAVKPTTIEARYIDIGPVLDKLNEMGCVIDKLELREVSRGGHASINCVKKVDALNAEIGDL